MTIGALHINLLLGNCNKEVYKKLTKKDKLTRIVYDKDDCSEITKLSRAYKLTRCEREILRFLFKKPEGWLKVAIGHKIDYSDVSVVSSVTKLYNRGLVNISLATTKAKREAHLITITGKGIRMVKESGLMIVKELPKP